MLIIGSFEHYEFCGFLKENFPRDVINTCWMVTNYTSNIYVKFHFHLELETIQFICRLEFLWILIYLIFMQGVYLVQQYVAILLWLYNRI